MNRGSELREFAVIAPNWLGDAVMSLPMLAALAAAHPKARLLVLARAGVAPVYEAAAMGLRVACLPPPPSLRLPMLEARPDVCILLPNSFHAALLAWRTRARRRIGYARDARGWLLTDAIPPRAAEAPRVHESFHYLELVQRAGLIAALPPERPVRLYPPPAAVERWRQRLGVRAVAIHAGASYGNAKRWLPERFADLARRLASAGHRVVLVGSASERALADEIRAQAGGGAAIDNLAGDTTLPELLALLAAAEFAVTNDSGPMHLAAAVGTPLVAMFGSTDERETYPLAQPGRLQLLKAAGVACSPCKLRQCPIDHRCMTRIEVEAVLAAAVALRQTPAPAPPAETPPATGAGRHRP